MDLLNCQNGSVLYKLGQTRTNNATTGVTYPQPSPLSLSQTPPPPLPHTITSKKSAYVAFAFLSAKCFKGTVATN